MATVNICENWCNALKGAENYLKPLRSNAMGINQYFANYPPANGTTASIDARTLNISAEIMFNHFQNDFNTWKQNYVTDAVCQLVPCYTSSTSNSP